MNVVEIKSCESQTTLSFSLYSRHEYENCFLAKISGAPFTGEVLASWTGWSGTKSWHAIDGELSLTATTTSLGKVTLVVEMSAGSGDYTLTATVKLEAGSLDRVADDVRSVFRST